MHGCGGLIDIGNLRIEKADEGAHEPALGLALLPKKEHVVGGKQGNVDLRDDGVFVTDNAGEKLLTRLQHAQEVVANLLFDRPGSPPAVA